MIDIPSAENKGSSGGQKNPPNGCDIIAKLPFQDVSQVVQGLAASKSKSLGGEIGAGLLAATFSQMASDVEAKNIEIKELRDKLEKKSDELHEWKRQAFVLEERVNANGKLRQLGNITITLGSALIGIAIELYRNSLTVPSYTVAVIGCGLILFGWFTGVGSKYASK